MQVYESLYFRHVNKTYFYFIFCIVINDVRHSIAYMAYMSLMSTYIYIYTHIHIYIYLNYVSNSPCPLAGPSPPQVGASSQGPRPRGSSVELLEAVKAGRRSWERQSGRESKACRAVNIQIAGK